MKALTLLMFIALIIQSMVTETSWADPAKRPFWTDKSSFIEGEDLFVVGIASNAKTVEEGRKHAFENGKVELMNYAQVTNIEAKGLVIETQMTFEEPNPNGTVTVFRLLRVPASKLVAIQGRLKEESRVQEQAVEKARIDLDATQQSLARKQRQLEAQNRQIEVTLSSVSQLQETLGQKAARIEQTQRDVEQLLQQLSAKVEKDAFPNPSISKMPNAAPSKQLKNAQPLTEKLKQAEAKLDAREQYLRALGKRAKERLEQEEKMARAMEGKCAYLEPGMTKEEVGQIMSEPAQEEHHFPSKTSRYKYTYMNKKGVTEIISVGFAFNNLVDSLDGCPGKSFSPYNQKQKVE